MVAYILEAMAKDSLTSGMISENRHDYRDALNCYAMAWAMVFAKQAGLI